MTAVREVHAEYRISVVERREIHGHVGLRARMWLNVDVLAAKDLNRPIASEVLGYVDELTSAVVSLTGIAFCVLVGQYRSHRLQHRFGDEVLGSDHLEVVSQ